MRNNIDRLVIETEVWRDFFSGRFHGILSSALSESFAQLLSFSNKENLISDPKALVDKLSVLDANDLSDTTKLFITRFETNSLNSSNRPKFLNIAQCLSEAVYSRSATEWKTDIRQAKILMQKANELENISRALRYARNVNAHTHKEVLDFGFSLTVFANTARLFEIFDYKNINDDDVNLIRNAIDDAIISIGRSRSSEIEEQKGESVSVEETKTKTIPLGFKIDPPIETDNEQKAFELEEEVKNQIEIPFEQPLESTELQRQTLTRLRPKIFKYFTEQGIVLERKNCFLNGSTLSDILLFKPKNIDDLKRVLSVEIILKRSPKIANTQLNFFGDKIIEVF